jgi:hypothetical protein
MLYRPRNQAHEECHVTLANFSAPPVKKTKVELMVNSQIIFLLIILLLMSITCAAGGIYYQVPGYNTVI